MLLAVPCHLPVVNYLKPNRLRTSHSTASPATARPNSHNHRRLLVCPWCAIANTPIPVRRARVIEIAGHLHPAQAEQFPEEGIGAVDVGADGGDVVHPCR